jgi:hypothetical protein
LIIDYSEEEGEEEEEEEEEEEDSIKKIDNTLRARTCALNRGRLNIIKWLRLAGEGFRTTLLRFNHN